MKMLKKLKNIFPKLSSSSSKTLSTPTKSTMVNAMVSFAVVSDVSNCKKWQYQTNVCVLHNVRAGLGPHAIHHSIGNSKLYQGFIYHSIGLEECFQHICKLAPANEPVAGRNGSNIRNNCRRYHTISRRSLDDTRTIQSSLQYLSFQY